MDLKFLKTFFLTHKYFRKRKRIFMKYSLEPPKPKLLWETPSKTGAVVNFFCLQLNLFQDIVKINVWAKFEEIQIYIYISLMYVLGEI